MERCIFSEDKGWLSFRYPFDSFLQFFCSENSFRCEALFSISQNSTLAEQNDGMVSRMLFTQHAHSLVIHTPAKLNLFLEILGTRSDGFHELETVMTSVDIYDTLSFQKTDSSQIEFRCHNAGQPTQLHTFGTSTSEDVPATTDNLVVQAAQLLTKYAAVSEGVLITLQKRIPVAAGLAGGSSDAAATLAGLNSFWKLGLSVEVLENLASQLGSDINFFLSDSPYAVCRGRGEIVTPEPIATPLHFVIVRPASGLSTPLVFRHYKETASGKSLKEILSALAAGRAATVGSLLYNALQSPAEKLNADIAILKQQFSKEQMNGHLMSGSGSAYFGICATRRQANVIARRFRSQNNWQVFAASTAI